MRTPEQKSFRRRLIAFAVVALAVLLIFLARLVWLQLVKGDYYYAQATAPPSSAASASRADGHIAHLGESHQKTVVWQTLF